MNTETTAANANGAGGDRARNKLPQRSAGNMRRTLMHPRDLPRTALFPCIYCATASIGKSKCVWWPFLAPFSIPSFPRADPSRAFFSTAPDILFSGTPLSRARFSRHLILQSHCIKSKACIKQPLRASPTWARTSRNTTETFRYGRRIGTLHHDWIPKGISKCNFRWNASQFINVPSTLFDKTVYTKKISHLCFFVTRTILFECYPAHHLIDIPLRIIFLNSF